MTKQEFTYVLLRYVPDPERMEPLNIGVVIQGAEGMKLKLDNHFGRLKGIDKNVYKRWRDFLEEEISGEQKSIFRPSRESPDFWKYLRSLTGDTVTMTPPLRLTTSDETSSDGILEKLYNRLVSRKEVERDLSPGRPDHPASEFRRIRKERNLDKRGLKKSHALKTPGGEYLWAPHRVLENGKIVAIDKIEVDESPDRTNVEIDRARFAASKVSRIKGKATRWIVLIDPLKDDAFRLDAADREDMKRAFEVTKKAVDKAKGEIISTPEEVSQVVSELEPELQPAA
ncbi:MAG: DUF3037 domain-containing protein [Planctomycetes bacterium]|nr:DUF3037 domain-containing protein [Planctomycetota bacterium]